MSKKITIKSEIHKFNSIDELGGQDKKLLEHSREAADLAYAPYSHFYVGAALLLENGEIIKANNQENVAYPSGLCAERIAIFYAGSQYPGIPVKAMAISARSNKVDIDEPVTPCGACRQVMAEYEDRYQSSIRLILMGEVGKIYIIDSVKNILPLMFNAEWLKK